ncbi:MAG: YjbF family lipoprotein [Spiribacter salinus]|uniref:YjbF family lipoprotein n=1 Tax=Spiribacter salinus TaxID=1335746 RepID=A0A540VNM3_9GAMM|nr:MAG: YjbF family lipoprotein [Spiribacter salinus]
MILRTSFLIRPVLWVTLSAMMLFSGCDQITRITGLTGKVPASEPQVIGPELMRVSIPAIEAQATLGPVARRDNVTVWQTLDGITLSFRSGSLIATRGLGADLMSADVAGRLEMLRNSRGASEGGYYPHIRSYLDGEDRTVFRSYQCRPVVPTDSEMEADRDSGLRRIEELCVSPTDQFTNVYWLNSNGAVIRSRQWISPTLEHMETASVPQ